MATTDARTMWQRTASNRIQEETFRAPKLAHCPILPKTQPEICQPGIVRGFEHTPSYYWSNSWGSLDAKTVWQMSPSAQCDYRSEYLALDEILESRCAKPAGLQQIAAQRSTNAKSGHPGVMRVTPSEYATGAELELEWQLIADPKPKSGLSISSQPAVAKKRNEYLKIDSSVEEKEVIAEDVTSESSQSLQKIQSLRESSMTRSLREWGALSSNSTASRNCEPLKLDQNDQDCPDKYRQMRGKYSSVSQSLCTAPTPSFMGSSVSWRTANKETLAALVAQKAAERLENCDLPTPLSKSALKSSLDSYHLVPDAQPDTSALLDRNAIASILQNDESTQLESHALPASPYIFVKPEACSPARHFARISQPLTIPTASRASTGVDFGCESFSPENRETSWNGGERVLSSSLGKSSGPLGEALCHSQTRAREAERQAERTFQDYQKISHLFFREASLSLTYRQWVSSLQAENTRLKMYVRHQQAAVWLEQSFFSPFSVLDRFSNRWKNFGKEHARRQMRQHFSALWPAEKEASSNFVIIGQDGAEIVMGCTLSFAFALGLSLAGAGLMLGWSMGWILLAY